MQLWTLFVWIEPKQTRSKVTFRTWLWTKIFGEAQYLGRWISICKRFYATLGFTRVPGFGPIASKWYKSGYTSQWLCDLTAAGFSCWLLSGYGTASLPVCASCVLLGITTRGELSSPLHSDCPSLNIKYPIWTPQWISSVVFKYHWEGITKADWTLLSYSLPRISVAGGTLAFRLLWRTN
jgi:hypothetical protein